MSSITLSLHMAPEYNYGRLILISLSTEFEFGPIQTQMTQKPMLLAKVHEHAVRASQNANRSFEEGGLNISVTYGGI